MKKAERKAMKKAIAEAGRIARADERKEHVARAAFERAERLRAKVERFDENYPEQGSHALTALLIRKAKITAKMWRKFPPAPSRAGSIINFLGLTDNEMASRAVNMVDRELMVKWLKRKDERKYLPQAWVLELADLAIRHSATTKRLKDILAIDERRRKAAAQPQAAE